MMMMINNYNDPILAPDIEDNNEDDNEDDNDDDSEDVNDDVDYVNASPLAVGGE